LIRYGAGTPREKFTANTTLNQAILKSIAKRTKKAIETNPDIRIMPKVRNVGGSADYTAYLLKRMAGNTDAMARMKRYGQR